MLSRLGSAQQEVTDLCSRAGKNLETRPHQRVQLRFKYRLYLIGMSLLANDPETKASSCFQPNIPKISPTQTQEPPTSSRTTNWRGGDVGKAIGGAIPYRESGDATGIMLVTRPLEPIPPAQLLRPGTQRGRAATSVFPDAVQVLSHVGDGAEDTSRVEETAQPTRTCAGRYGLHLLEGWQCPSSIRHVE
jgi:hypothetical protein